MPQTHMFSEKEWKKYFFKTTKLRGTWRKTTCQAVHVAPIFFPPLQVEWKLGRKVLETSSISSS
jgi:hypothetical protein